MKTIDEALTAQASRWTEQTFLFFPEREETVSYWQMAERCAAAGRLLQALGVRPGDTVALLLPNIPEFVYLYWGAMRIGAVACPINTLLTGPEIAYILQHSEAVVLATTPAFFPELARVSSELPGIRALLSVSDPTAPEQVSNTLALPDFPNILDFAQALETIHSPHAANESKSDFRPSPETVAMMIYTSGTTGKPKGVLLTHGNLIANGNSIGRWFSMNEQTRLMCVLPLFHVNGEVVTLMTPWLAGASVVLNRKFSASNFWPLVAAYRVTAFSAVPTLLSILTAAGDPGLDRSSLTYGICGAAPLPVETHKRFESMFDVPVYEGYGLSETTCYSTFNPPDTTRRVIGSIGVAVDNEVAIWDEGDQPAPDGEPGEIVVRGENVMAGYYKRPEETASAMRGGWFHTGDWGRREPDGFFYIMDRVKDMIIRGGENISPREIDEVLYTHPAVSAAATIGVPNALYGEEVKSFVVLHANATATETELLAYCEARLASFKRPKFIVFIDEIPKGPTGKLLRRVLRDMG